MEVAESVELLLVFLLVIAAQATMYLFQRWMDRER